MRGCVGVCVACVLRVCCVGVAWVGVALAWAWVWPVWAWAWVWAWGIACCVPLYWCA